MNKFYFLILLLFVFSLSVQGKKEEKTNTATASAAVPKSNNNLNAASKSTGISRTNQNILELIQLFKSLLNQALSKADFSSVRGVLSSPLSIGATALSVLLGGIVLMSFYESPLSPLPVPPLPQAPVGRFPPENPIVAPMNGGHGGPMQRQSSSYSQYYELTPEQQAILNYLKKQIETPQTNQPQQYFYSKSQSNYQPSRRSDGFGYLNYFNQMQNNMRPSNPYANNYNNYNLVSDSSSNKPVHSVPSSVQQLKKDAPIKAATNTNAAAADTLNTASSTGHLSIAAPPSSSNTNHNSQILNYLNTPSNIQNNQLNVQQSGPVYRPIDAIKEEDFDQKQLVQSQLSQVQFKTSPELADLEEKLKRSSE